MLCVTENRDAFMPWLAWNWRRQTYEPRELVLVDSNPDVDTKANEALYDRDDVRFVRMPNRTGIGPKLQIALELAKGDYVCIWSDDDWQHPDRLQRSVEAAQIGQGFDVVGWETGWFAKLPTRTGYYFEAIPYKSRGIITSAAAALVKTSAARLAVFQDIFAEDTAWIRDVLRSVDKSQTLTLQPWAHSLWLVHGRNTSPRGQLSHLWQPVEAFDELRTLVGSPAWGGTTTELQALRRRIDDEYVVGP